MTHLRPILLMIAALLGGMVAAAPAPEVDAQAYCALRDPVRQVYELFPEATSYRSLVRTVDEDARSRTGEALPFTLHFNELGRHTLYVALRGEVPLGVVHVRSEAGRWGLVEIAWALSLDLEVVGFRFQRCRDTARDQIEAGAIAATVVGRGFEGLRALLDEDGDGLSADAEPVIAGKTDAVRRLMITTLRSALKTVAVTDAVWAGDLRHVRLIRAGLTAFPDAATVEVIHDPYGHDTWVGISTGIDRAGVTALLIRDGVGGVLGIKCETPWSAGDARDRVWWTVDAAGRSLTAVTANADDAGAFAALHGRVAADFARCSTSVELAGKEVLTVANACLDAVGKPAQVGER